MGEELRGEERNVGGAGSGEGEAAEGGVEEEAKVSSFKATACMEGVFRIGISGNRRHVRGLHVGSEELAVL